MSTICGSFDKIIASSENVKTFSEVYLILQPKMGRGIRMRNSERGMRNASIKDYRLRIMDLIWLGIKLLYIIIHR